MIGKVYLVGAGPGAPDLLTVRAVRILSLADIVLHDALVSPEVLALISSRARVINVGKRCGRKTISQNEINELMVQFAATAETIVRLKSGDPLVFGRAGEEIEALQRANVEVEIVPGVTAALAAAAATQISLTDRRTSEQLLLISAHHEATKPEIYPDCDLTDRTTIVVYMPGDYGRVADRLLRSGLSPDTPCMLVSKVSTENQEAYTTTLDQIGQAPTFPTPCLLIVGKTVAKGKLPAMDTLSAAVVQDSGREPIFAVGTLATPG